MEILVCAVICGIAILFGIAGTSFLALYLYTLEPDVIVRAVELIMWAGAIGVVLLSVMFWMVPW